MYNVGGGDLVARGAFFTFFAGKKVTKNLVAQKTHLRILAIAFRSVLLSRLVVFQIQFLISDFEI